MIKIVFCLPGELFSNNFLRSWTKLLLKLPDYNVTPIPKWVVGSNVYKIRNDILAAGKSKNPTQKPFGGKLEYDYIMWIDSDQVFEPEQFQTLLDHMENNEDLHIVAGTYLKDDNKNYTSVINFNHPHFPADKAGFLTPAELKGKKNLIPVEFTGMGFMLVRNGVFEGLDYPWFAPIPYSFNNNETVGYTNEDAGFCKRAKDEGFETFIDPTVIIGHEKSIILR